MHRLHYCIHTETKYIHFHKMQAREILFIKPEKQVREP